MTWHASVTFEHEASGPRTARLMVEAGGAHTAAARAIREARRQFRGTHYTSVVVCLEKAEDGDADEEESA